MMVEEQKEKYFTVKEAVKQLGIEYSVLNKACHEGRVECSVIPSPTRVNANTFLISESALTKWYVEVYKPRPSVINATVIPTNPTNSKSLSDASIKELFAEINRRLTSVYEDGYRKGRKDAKAEFMSVFKEFK